MPGIHFIRCNNFDLTQPAWDGRLNRLLHDHRYVREDIYSSDTCRLSVTRYPEYPVSVYDLDEYLIVLEGRLYGLEENKARSELQRLCSLVFTSDLPRLETIGPWFLEHDGDFVIAMRQKSSGKWALVNDPLGRLPLYHYRHLQFDCLSREVGLVSRLADNPKPDPLGMGQYLLFGFPLGGRLLWQDNYRLPPATLALWKEGSEPLYLVYLSTLDFSLKQQARSVEEIVEEMVPLFESACRDRTDGAGLNLLSLSGGLDSRTVAAGLKNSGCDFRAATFGLESEPSSKDLQIAQRLAAELDLDWEKCLLPAPRGTDVQTIFRLKDGLINSSQAYDVAYFDHLRSRYARNSVHFSGDGGDKTLPGLVPERRFASTGDLASYIISRHRLMSVNDVEKLVDLPHGSLVASLTEHLASYPEKSLSQKYVHFMIQERAMRWLFEGEDRNRCEFWSCTPFYSLPFFTAAMSCPEDMKRNHQLYRSFLMRLSPVAAGIPDARNGLALDSPSYSRHVSRRSRAARYPGLVRKLRAVVGKTPSYAPDDAIVKSLEGLLNSDNALADCLDSDSLSRIISRPARLGRAAFENLFALSAVITAHLSPSRDADLYFDREFS